MKMKVINMAMKKVGDDKLRRKVVSFLLVTLMMATITPVHADEVSEPTTAATEVTTTETKPTTTEKKETTHHKKKTVKKDKKTKKKNTKKDGKKKSKQKEKSKKKENKKSTIPMPKRAVKKKGCDTVQKKIVKMQSKIKKLQKEQKNIRKEIKKENNKKEALQRFYQQYPTEREATMKLRGQKITPLTKISEEDDALRNRLFSLANTFHDDQLRKIASEYVFGVRDLNFEDLLNEDDTIDLNTYLKGKYIAPTQNMQIGIKNKDQEIQKLKKQIKDLGPVNINAIEDYKEVSERYEFMQKQHEDIVTAEAHLAGLMEELEEAMRRQFNEKFKDIQRVFQEVFVELFGGGEARLELTDDDVLESGIRIIAQPPGKKLQNMMQLSGGEKALTAISLLFAIQNLKPSPFCLLDEIEAALDDSNVTRFAKYLHKLTKDTQFIVITHRRGTMMAADVLYGITMQEKGISTQVSVNLIENDLDE